MAHFYGIVHNQKGQATRCGSKQSGLSTTAASYQGAVHVLLREVDGVDFALVRLIPWEGSGVDQVLYEGPVGGTAELIALNKVLEESQT